jgi:multiple sugar transport system substrate-binding protein
VETQKGQWTYGPNWAGAFAHLQDLWGKAVAGEIATTEIAPQLQEWIVADLKQQGIAVVED